MSAREGGLLQQGLRAGRVDLVVRVDLHYNDPKVTAVEDVGSDHRENPGWKDLFWDEVSEDADEYWSNFLDHSDSPNVRFIIDLEGRSARLLTVREVRSGGAVPGLQGV